MNYDLARRLKEAGFPQYHLQNRSGYFWDFDKSWWHTLENDHPDEEDSIYSPTLSELIEACPKIWKIEEWFEGDFTLQFYNPREQWFVGYASTDDWYEGPNGEGSTPEIAVAELWLKLNEKNEKL